MKRILVSVFVLLAVMAGLFGYREIANAGGGKVLTILEANWGVYSYQFEESWRTNIRTRSNPAYQVIQNFLYADGAWQKPYTINQDWYGYGFYAQGGLRLYRTELAFASNPKNPMVTLNWQPACLPGPYELYERDAAGNGEILVVNTTSGSLSYQNQGNWEELARGEKLLRSGATGVLTLYAGPQGNALVCTEISWQQVPDGQVVPQPTTPTAIPSTPIASTPTATSTPVPTTATPTAIPAQPEAISVHAGWNLIAFPCAPWCGQTASEILRDFESQGIQSTALAAWESGGWRVHIKGLSANDFPLTAWDGYFLMSRNAGTWNPLQPPMPPPASTPIPSS